MTGLADTTSRVTSLHHSGYGSRWSCPWPAPAPICPVHDLQATPLPHVDDCYLCHKCHTGKPPGRHLLARMLGAAEPLWDLSAGADTSSGSAGIDSSASSSEASDTGRSLLAKSKKPAKKEEQMYVPPGFKFNIMPMKDEIAAKSLKPNCTECYGCDTQIQPLQAAAATNQLGQNMKIEVGASPEWLFFAGEAEQRATVVAVVACIWHGWIRCWGRGHGRGEDHRFTL